MTVFAGVTFSGAQLQNGAYANGYYSGSSVSTTVDAISFDSFATFNKVGDKIMGVYTGAATSGTAVLTYDGFYTDAAGSPVYVFSYGTGNLSTLAIGPNGDISDPTLFTRLDTTDAPPMYNVCFLRGTLIATPAGETPVEELRAGDPVATVVEGAIAFQPARWIGTRRMTVRPDAATIENFPVRIRAGAVRDGVPSRDLLVTPEHCLHMDGKLIPARMLVNGSSIVVDTGITDYEYFHVELDRHAILLADGMEAESYLDTGNRGNFANTDLPALRPDLTVQSGHARWADDAAAPLATDRDTVEPIWRALRERAATLGLFDADPAPVLVHEPDLHLVAETGQEIRPTLVEGGRYAFVVSGHVGSLRLVSRSFRPSDVVGPFVDDRRALGVQVGRIDLSDGGRHIASDLHLTTDSLAGWHAVEGGVRWTDGDAVLPVDLSSAGGRPVVLDIEITAAGPYRARPLPIAA